jgi:hypothetical protein
MKAVVSGRGVIDVARGWKDTDKRGSDTCAWLRRRHLVALGSLPEVRFLRKRQMTLQGGDIIVYVVELGGTDTATVLGSSTVSPENREKSVTLNVSKWVSPCVRMAATYRAS